MPSARGVHHRMTCSQNSSKFRLVITEKYGLNYVDPGGADVVTSIDYSAIGLFFLAWNTGRNMLSAKSSKATKHLR